MTLQEPNKPTSNLLQQGMTPTYYHEEDDGSRHDKYGQNTSKHQLEGLHILVDALETKLTFQKYTSVPYIAWIIAMSVGIVTALIGATTWILIPKWRKFRNYVFLMVVMSFAAVYCLLAVSWQMDRAYWVRKTIDLFLCASAWWLLVASVMFYMDLVKVFRSDVTHRTLKSSALVWGVAAATTALCAADEALWGVLQPLTQYDMQLLLPLLVNCAVYARVLRSLLRESSMQATRSTRHRTQVATLTFLMSGAVMLGAVLAAEPPAAPIWVCVISQLIYAAQTIAIDICFLMLQSNRKAWRDYYRDLSNSNASSS